MAITSSKGTFYYQELHKIHVAVGTIYSFNLTITKLTSSENRFKIVVALKDFIRSIASIPLMLLKSLKTFLLLFFFSKISLGKFILYRNLIPDSIVNSSIR